MGGEGSGRKPDVFNMAQKQAEPVVPIAPELFLPNYGGVKPEALKTSPVDITGSGVESDPIWLAQSGSYIKTEADPVWLAQSGSFLTSFTETDPVFLALSGAFLTAESDPVFLALSGDFITAETDPVFLSLSGAFVPYTGATTTVDLGSEDLETTGNISGATATLAGMNISNDGSKTTLIGKTGDYTVIGNQPTGQSFNSENDLVVSGKLEVKTDTFCNWIHMADSAAFDFGYPYLRIKKNGFFPGTGAFNSMVLSRIDLYNKVFDHAVQTNPTLFIHSATDPDSDNTQWLGLTHDQTDGVITTGTGAINLAPASGLKINGTAGFTGTINAVSGSVVVNGIVTGWV